MKQNCVHSAVEGRNTGTEDMRWERLTARVNDRHANALQEKIWLYLEIQEQMHAEIRRVLELTDGEKMEQSAVVSALYQEIRTDLRRLKKGRSVYRHHIDRAARDRWPTSEMCTLETALKFVTPQELVSAEQVEKKELKLESFLPASSIHQFPTLHRQAGEMVADHFPEGDDANFELDFLADPDAVLHCLVCGPPQKGFLVTMAGVQRLRRDLPFYIDWRCAQRHGKIHGFSPLLLQQMERNFPMPNGSIHATKPWMSLSYVLSLGSVCDGCALPGEYKDAGFVTTRTIPEEQGAYPIKGADPEEVKQALAADDIFALPPGVKHPWTFKGAPAFVMNSMFRRMNHRSQRKPEHDAYYDSIEELCADNAYVGTTDIRHPTWSQLRQSSTLIFEPSAISPAHYERIMSARQLRREKHAH